MPNTRIYVLEHYAIPSNRPGTEIPDGAPPGYVGYEGVTILLNTQNSIALARPSQTETSPVTGRFAIVLPRSAVIVPEQERYRQAP